MAIKDDFKFAQNAKTILKRINSTEIYTDFVIDLTKECSKAGKDYLLTAIMQDIRNSNRLLNYDGVLNIYKKDLSGKAPDLLLNNYLVNQKERNTTVVDMATLDSKYTLLLFYKSDCGFCEETIAALQSNYNFLVANGFRIISIAADTDEAIFKSSSSQFSWRDKYCDLDGIIVINFKNYAVIGTPTMYVLDNKGMIQTKISTGQELLDWAKKRL